jgi:serine protease Do
VVDIITKIKSPPRRSFFGSEPTIVTLGGSGFFIDQDEKYAYILTNNHVIMSDIDEETATLEDLEIFKNTEYTYWIMVGNVKMRAYFAGSYRYADIGMLKVPLSNFKGKEINLAKLGDSNKIKVGQRVIAIGNPYNLTNTVTEGIVSQIHRKIRLKLLINDFIQTSAPINPGNSGGPLINMQSEVIGINSAGIGQADNLGFAIPINYAKRIIDRLKKGSIIERGYLGIKIFSGKLKKSFDFNDLSDLIELSKLTNITETDTLTTLNEITQSGALIIKVSPHSPAGKILKKGDVVTNITRNGKKVKIKEWRDFILESIDASIGEEIELTIKRANGKILEEQKVKLTVAPWPRAKY